MDLIQIAVNCSAPILTALPKGQQRLEVEVRSIVSNMLWKFYGSVSIRKMRFNAPASVDSCFIYVEAYGRASSLGREDVEVTMEDELSRSLTEFFEEVGVEVTITNSLANNFMS